MQPAHAVAERQAPGFGGCPERDRNGPRRPRGSEHPLDEALRRAIHREVARAIG